MNKRYQVFVSSTYADLKDERQRVIQTIMEMDCIPSGMELFPAADEDQFEFIKRIINDCDYYLLIIGGRYGSTTSEGVSYTEKEYDYAVSIGLKVIAFIHHNPDEIIVGKTDKDPQLADRLSDFRSKVETGRLVKFWKVAGDLPGLVSLSLSKTIKTYPAVGWARADQLGSNQLLNEINDVRKENQDLRLALEQSQIIEAPALSNLAGLSDSFTIRGQLKPRINTSWRPWVISISWGKIFALISPHLLSCPNDAHVMLGLKKAVLASEGISNYESRLEDQDFQTIKIQFTALGLVKIQYLQTTQGGMSLFWSLTPTGEATMTELRVIRSTHEQSP